MKKLYFTAVAAFYSIASISQLGPSTCQFTNQVNGMCMEKVGNYIYMGHWGNPHSDKISIYDNSVAGTATFVSDENHSAFSVGSILDIESDGTYLYTCSRYTEQVMVLDYSNPTDLNMIGSVSTGASSIPSSIKVVGNYVYVTDSQFSGLKVIDISTPSAPVIVHTVAGMGSYTTRVDVDASGNFLYVASQNGLHVVDISSPTAAFISSTLTDNPSYYRCHVNGSYLYAAQGADLYTYDISTPSTPVLQGAAITLTNGIYSFDGDANYLYVGTYATGTVGAVTLLDISAPNSPVIVDEYPADNHRGHDVFANAGFVYSLDEIWGDELCINGVQPPCADSTSSFSVSEICSYTVPSGDETYFIDGVYMDTIPNSTGCDSIMTITVTITPLFDVSLSIQDTVICMGQSTMVSLDTTESGIKYYLRNDFDDSILDGPYYGDGNAAMLSTGNLNSMTSFNVVGFVGSGMALNFDNSNSVVEVPDHDDLDPANITVETWVKVDVANGYDVLVFKADPSNWTNGYGLNINNSGTNFQFFVDGWSNGLVTSTTTITPGVWYHVAGTYDGIETKIFVNGVEESSTSYVGTMPNTTNLLRIGNDAGGYPMTGDMDEVRVWNYARNASEIAAQMDSCLDGTQLGLVALYNFEEGFGLNTADLTMNGHDGNLVSMDGANDWVLSNLNCGLCSIEMSDIVSVDIAAPSITVDSTLMTTCFGDTDGQGFITVSGTAGPYTYDWDHDGLGDNDDLEDQDSLMAGTYNVMVTDSMGCTNSETVIIAEPADLFINWDGSTPPTACGAADGLIEITVTGGTGPYTYDWDNDGTGDFDDTEDLTTSAGVYNVVVMDANGCSQSEVTGLWDALAPTVNIDAVTDNLCWYDSLGVIDISLTGGTSPFTYLWSDGQTIEDAVNLPTGFYTVEVTDADGCIGVWGDNVNDPGEIITNSTLTDVICNGDSTGTAVLAISGGTPGYSEDWGTANPATLPGGYTAYTITDANNCILIDSVMIIEPAVVAATDSTLSMSCFGIEDGEIHVSPSGGVGPYLVVFEGTDTTDFWTGLDNGTYNYTVEDANGCSNAFMAIVTEPMPLSFNLNVTDEVAGDDGEIDLTVNGGTAPYTYDWDNDGTGDFDDTEDLTGLSDGDYTIVFMDANGCSDSTTATIANSQLGVADLDVSFNVYPNPNNGQFIIDLGAIQNISMISVIDAAGKSVYLNTTINTNQIDMNLQNIEDGLYMITITTENNQIVNRFVKK